MTQPQLATHEAKFSAWYTAADPYDGLQPYWALRQLLIVHADGYVETTAEIDGEQWEIRLNYSDSGIATRPSDDLERDVFREFDLRALGYSQRKLHVNFSPRFEGMCQPSGEAIDTPWQHFDVDAGVDAKVQGSNIDLDEYHGLISRCLQELASEAGFELHHSHFGEPFGGRIQEVERYLRLNYDLSRKLIGDTGVMQRLMMLLADERGTQAEYKLDNEGRIGKNHRLLLHSEDVAEVFPRHRARWGRQVKSYLLKEDDAFEADDALYHPKVGALFRQSLSAGAADWDERERLVRELDETVLSLLSWSDIPVDVGDGSGGTGGNTVFVADDHFDVQPRHGTLPIAPDPTPELEAKQESILMWTLQQISDTESDADVVQTLAADGGMHRDDLADATGWSMSTLYRALDRLGGAVESDNGYFRFASRQLAKDIEALIQRVDDVKQTVTSQAERLLDVEIRSKSNSAFQRWLARYGAEFVDASATESGSPVIRIDTALTRLKHVDHPHLVDVIQDMVSAWREDHRDDRLIQDARVNARVDGSRETAVVAAVL